MIKKLINQNTNYKLKLLDSMECEYIFNNEPINRLNNKNNLQEKLPNNKNEQIKELKNEINSIENCKLKENAKILQVGSDKGYLLHDFKVISPECSVAGVEVSDYAIKSTLNTVKRYIKKLSRGLFE